MQSPGCFDFFGRRSFRQAGARLLLPSSHARPTPFRPTPVPPCSPNPSPRHEPSFTTRAPIHPPLGLPEPFRAFQGARTPGHGGVPRRVALWGRLSCEGSSEAQCSAKPSDAGFSFRLLSQTTSSRNLFDFAGAGKDTKPPSSGSIAPFTLLRDCYAHVCPAGLLRNHA